jgi:hypothetical protein
MVRAAWRSSPSIATCVSDEEFRYSAEDLGFCSCPPGAGAAVRVRDILLVEVTHVVGDADVSDEYRAHPPAGVPRFVGLERVCPEPFDLGRGVMLGRLAREEYDLIANACEPRGHFFRAVRQAGVRYAFWRDVTHEAISGTGLVDHSRWDADGSIYYAVALSRYVRDNAAGTDHAARVVEYEGGSQQVQPQRIYESSHVYRLPLVERDWLDDHDAASLRRLLEVSGGVRRISPSASDVHVACRIRRLDEVGRPRHPSGRRRL